MLASGVVDYVIAISVDGLRPDVITQLGEANLPNFHRLRNEGSFTNNARTDNDFTVTLPNHAGMLTGRAASGSAGHSLFENVDPGGTLHDLAGSYVASAFDVSHDAGLSTGLYASKSKFALFDRTWNESAGALDTTGVDDGRDKIDTYEYNLNTSQLVDSFVADMAADPHHFSMLHIRDPDSAGHGFGWLTSTYLNSIITVDSLLGDVFNLIDTDPTLNGNTAIVLTTDHGGENFTHVDPILPSSYTIPFHVWGPSIAAGMDLYLLNGGSHQDPSVLRVANDATSQPIRNMDLGNLSLDLLGLTAIPDSTFNQSLDLQSSAPQDFWQNPADRFDVDGDGRIIPQDLLFIVNEINRNGSRDLQISLPGSLGPPERFFDVSGDGRINPVDALQLINEINRRLDEPASGEGQLDPDDVDAELTAPLLPPL
jgi:hypothetical protein